MEAAGIEPPQKMPGNTKASAECGAESGAVDAANGPIDTTLAKVISRWSSLPIEVRESIRSLIERHGREVK
jgi:hypothetical protein